MLNHRLNSVPTFFSHTSSVFLHMSRKYLKKTRSMDYLWQIFKVPRGWTLWSLFQVKYLNIYKMNWQEFLIQTFLVPAWWIWTTLVIPWLFLQGCHNWVGCIDICFRHSLIDLSWFLSLIPNSSNTDAWGGQPIQFTIPKSQYLTSWWWDSKIYFRRNWTFSVAQSGQKMICPVLWLITKYLQTNDILISCTGWVQMSPY